MLRTIIIDDEANARITLRSMLASHCPEVHVVAEASGMESGQLALESEQPDLVFLDVRLHPGTGFDILEAIPEPSFQTIFITAHDEYAVRAIKVSALDYLQKPVAPEELVAAVEKVRQRQSHSLPEENQVRYQVIREFLSYGSHPKRMVLPTQHGFQVVETDQIIRCEADRNYTCFILNGGKNVLIPRTLKSYEEILVPAGFFRIHNSHLINIQYIGEYRRRKKGGIVFLKDGTEIPVSESRKVSFQQMFLR